MDLTARENAAIVQFASDLAATSGVSLSAAVEAIRAGMERDEAMRRAGREDAARDIQAHADEFAPADGNVQQRRLRRCLGIASRVAAGPPTDDEVQDAIRSGNYAVCHLDEAGQSIPPGGEL